MDNSPTQFDSIVEEVRSSLDDLSCQVCDIVDTSADHQGHAGNSGGAHLIMTLVSDKFSGLSLLERERLVTDRFKTYIPQRIHAISVRGFTPDEYRNLNNQ